MFPPVQMLYYGGKNLQRFLLMLLRLGFEQHKVC